MPTLWWWLIWAAVALGAALAVHVFVAAPRALTQSHVDVPIDGLPAPLDGYTIAVLADVHHQPGTGLRQIERAIAMANAARPDLVALLGDYSVSWKTTSRLNARLYRRALAELAEPLRALRAPDGVFAVLGNHDHYYDADAVHRWLETLGVRVLVNACTAVERGGAQLLVGGVDDPTEAPVDPAAGCGDRWPDAPTVVLAHHPDAILQFTTRHRIDLVLAGHTHGGQIVLPFYGAPVTFSRVCQRRTASGWVPNARARLYVSRGIGWQTPGRFRCSPEVVIVRLRRVVAPSPASRHV